MTEIPFHPLANLFPLLEGAEFRGFVEDVRRNGLLHPVIVHDGQVLDGRNRQRACHAAQVPVRYEPFSGADPVAFVISANVTRRHLTESQRAMVAAKLTNIDRGGDRKTNQTANLQFDAAPPAISSARASELLSVSERSVNSARAVRDRGTPELIAKVERGQMPVSRAEKEIRTERRKEQATEIAKSVPSTASRYRLISGSVLELLAEPAGSVDVICTDPPYPQEFIEAFGDLSVAAAHALKPGGVLLCMSGQSWLPEVIRQLGGQMTYQWMLAYLTPGGQATQVFPRKVNTFWKPVLVYTKGPYVGEWFGDVSRSDVNDNDKAHHHWGQSVSGMRDLMKRFVKPGDVVADPFLGGGTTAVVALELGASFIGCDIDDEAITTTKARLSDAKLVA